MALIEYTLDGKVDKVQRAIDRIRAFDPIAKARRADGMPCAQWGTAEDVFRWWLEGPQKDPADELDQLSLF
jgi:hypothetical protein